MISLLITVEVDPDRTEEFVSYILEEAQEALEKEPGCLRFEVSRSCDQSNVFTLTEAYTDLEALEHHRQTPHFLLFKERAANGLILKKTGVLGQILNPSTQSA